MGRVGIFLFTVACLLGFTGMLQFIVGIPAVNTLLAIIAVSVVVHLFAFYSAVEQFGGKVSDSEN